MRRSVAVAVNQAKRCSHLWLRSLIAAGEAGSDLLGDIEPIWPRSPIAATAQCGVPAGLGAFGGSPGFASGSPLGFAVFGAPGGATVPGVGPTGGSPGGRSVGGGTAWFLESSARCFNQAWYSAGASPT